MPVHTPKEKAKNKSKLKAKVKKVSSGSNIKKSSKDNKKISKVKRKKNGVG